jgi:4'-phosphopantetheinyl transferase
LLQPGEIHVWWRDISNSIQDVEPLRKTLSEDELERAARFRFDRDRDEFVIGRGTLRKLVGEYQHQAASKVRFEYSNFGRPFLRGEEASSRLEFNISHSSGILLTAFARDRRIGVDVELIRSDFNPLEIAERFFSATERKTLRELAADAWSIAFFRCWTRKEAFIKALGEGLSHPLDKFDVSFVPDAPAALMATRPDALEAGRWLLCDVPMPQGYVAALAAER